MEKDIIKHQDIEAKIYKEQIKENIKRENNLKKIKQTHKTITPSQQFIAKEEKSSFPSLKSIEESENDDLFVPIENDENSNYNSGEDLSYRSRP